MPPPQQEHHCRYPKEGISTLHPDQQPVLDKGTLYVVATPIGNLQDITLRALDTLRKVDLVAAEDTRNSAKLLQHFGIAARMQALHEHNERSAAELLIKQLSEGKSIALISDAGTPAISDPGAYLVNEVRRRGYRVCPIPGPSAVATALSASGDLNPHYLFYGFLPPKHGARSKVLEQLAPLPYTLVFYEAPHRVMETVNDLAGIFGPERNITFCRELTKLFESIHTCPLSQAKEWLEEDSNRLKGEFVLLVDGQTEATSSDKEKEETRLLEILLAELPLKQAVKLAVEISGGKKNRLYELALAMQKQH
jgi:16S rRNA (cytidine1402-2'-O)-methyltransferase